MHYVYQVKIISVHFILCIHNQNKFKFLPVSIYVHFQKLSQISFLKLRI